MDLEEVIWGYIPLIIAFGIIIYSYNLLIRKKSILVITLSILITVSSGYAIYYLGFMILKTAWPSFLPHLLVGFSLVLILIQFTLTRNNTTEKTQTAESTEEKMLELIKLLEKAERYLSEFRGGYSGQYISAEDFHQDFKLELDKLKNGNNESVNTFWIWFAPTYHWDDFTGSDLNSEKYGNTIFEKLSAIKTAANTSYI